MYKETAIVAKSLVNLENGEATKVDKEMIADHFILIPHDVVDKTKEGIDNDARVVKEILYYQQNLEKGMGLRSWNFNLNPEYARNTAFAGIGSIILLILGFGVLPTSEEGLRFPFTRKKRAKREASSE